MPLRTRLPVDLGAITLRPFELTDFDDYCDYRCRPDVARFVPWPPHDREDARAGLQVRVANRRLDKPGDRFTPAIVDTATGTVIGELMLAWSADHDHAGEIGFAIHPDYQGRGLVKAGARWLLAIGFDEIGLHRIYGQCDARNGASAALLRALGLRQEAHLRDYIFAKGELCDELIFAILEPEYRAG